MSSELVDREDRSIVVVQLDRDVTFDLTPEATRWVGEKGYDEAFGARPLARDCGCTGAPWIPSKAPLQHPAPDGRGHVGTGPHR